VFDVIETYKELVHQHSIVWPIDKPRPHPFFLCLKPKWKAFDEVWFMFTPIGYNQLHPTINKLNFNFPYLREKILSNNTG
jgi:hypothetical protein